MTSANTPPPGQPDPADLLALGLATQSADDATSSAPPLTPSELAAEFPQLEILELLGRGGMGAVYKARQRDLDRLVALKILRPGLDADPGFAGRFTREARALAQLNHSGIVTLYEFGKTTAGRYFILMEFVDGVNLRQLLAAGRLSPREALAIVPPLCDALQYAHDRGLIHRDIKPENLLIDRLGRVKIADFGIAKIATGKSEASSSVEITGTPAYMAPEQRDRPAEVDHRADLYALGVVFYQMLTGELPATDQLRPPSTRVQIDVRLDEIVLRALEKDPSLRYSAANDFKTQVETVINSPAATTSAQSHNLRKFIIAVTCAFLVGCIYFIAREFTLTASATSATIPASGNQRTLAADHTKEPGNSKSKETNQTPQPTQPSVQFLMQSSPTTFKELTAQIRGVLATHFPDALLNESDNRFEASFATQEFQIHNQSKSGAITTAARTQTGPSNNGFMLTVSRITEPYQGQILLPVAGRAPYWNDFQTTGFDPERLEGVHVAIRFGANLPRPFHEQITRILGWIHQPTRHLLDNQGQPLTVVSEPFLTEKDIAAIDQISGSDGRKLRVSLTPAGAFRLNQLTQAALGRRIAVLIDGRVLTAPVINAELSTNEIELPDSLTEPETQRLLASFPGPAASAYTQVVNQAHDWLRIVDQGDYAQSWLNASASLRKAITQEAWTAALKIARGSSPAITVTRRLKTTQASPVLPGAGEGHYFVLQFYADMDNESVAERLTLTKEPTGDWRVAGYLVRPSSGAEQEAASQAQAWLDQIDAGQFGLSWDLASDAFRLAITRDQWIASLTAVRPPLGKVKIRLINTTQTATNLPGTPDGRYIVMTFNTAFENRRTAVETVTFEELKDGTLRPSGYFIK
jgi:serine/threonine protein kinase